jgi:hypothetical protein
MTDAEYEKLARRVAHLMGDDDAAAKSLWRMAAGCRERAVEVVRAFGQHLSAGLAKTLIETDNDFCDYVCAYVINGGLEVEWLYWSRDEYDADHDLKRIAAIAKKALI